MDLFGKKVMLPAGTIDRIDHGERKVYVGPTKAEIKQAPEFDDSVRKEPDYHSRLGEYYLPMMPRGSFGAASMPPRDVPAEPDERS